MIFPNKDDKFEDRTITGVTTHENGWEIDMDGWGLFINKPSTVEPKLGMSIRTYGLLGQPVRGVFLDGKKIFYRTEEEENKRHAETVAISQTKKKTDFEPGRAAYEAQVAALPEVFQRRIKKFQDTNPNFDWEFGGYEVFCCEQALAFATAIPDKDKLIEWSKLDWEEQKKQVPALDDGHSGNTFGASVRLAYHYLTEQENVVREHGALVTLVGCQNYGYPHPDS